METRNKERLAVPESHSRRLAAILAADIAGYSALMNADEARTVSELKAHQAEVLPMIGAFGGRIIDTAGDGILAEFPSVVNAVKCAVAVQERMARRNAAVEPESRLQFRVGINVGDIIWDEDRIYGDGINIAARLEALAKPGGICMTESTYRQIEGKIDLNVTDAGERQLKNIARPVRVYEVHAEGTAAAPISAVARRPSLARSMLIGGVMMGLVAAAVAIVWLAPLHSVPSFATSGGLAPVMRTGDSPILSIVVLPFVMLSGDARQDYFADGITESLTTDLSRALPGSFVVARDTAFTYKGKSIDARQLHRELDVDYVLGGSVLVDSERVRVNAQLVQARTGSGLWADRFDTTRSDLLQVQDEIVGRLSRAVGLQVIDVEARRRARERPRNPEAIDLVMRGRAVANRPSSPATMTDARELFARALNAQQDNTDALAGIATTLVFEVVNSYYEAGNDERLQRAQALLARALAIDPHHLAALKAKAVLLRAQGKFNDAIAAAQAVLAENPGEPWVYKEIGLSTMYLGRPEEALGWFARADRLGPRDPGRWTWLDGEGQALILLGRNAQAVQSLRAALDSNANVVDTYALLASAFALSGRAGEAQAALARYQAYHPEVTVASFRRHTPVPLERTSPDYQARRERLKDGLRKAGMSD